MATGMPVSWDERHVAETISGFKERRFKGKEAIEFYSARRGRAGCLQPIFNRAQSPVAALRENSHNVACHCAAHEAESFQISHYSRRFRGDRSATSAIEFAILSPLFIFFVMGMVAYGIYFGAAHSVQQIAADAARTAIAGLK